MQPHSTLIISTSLDLQEAMAVFVFGMRAPMAEVGAAPK